MSQYVSKLRERDGIRWPPVGMWQTHEGLERLRTFAENLYVPETRPGTDLLNSIPTPWARALLFEAALFDPAHPAHDDVKEQWRGLLGLVALADLLRLKVEVRAFSLASYSARVGCHIAKAFSDLRPVASDAGDDLWNHFYLIYVDGKLVGATSPRTLLFTSVGHECPESIPFRSPTGRLADPAEYYRAFDDRRFLGHLAAWVTRLRARIADNEQVVRILSDGDVERATRLDDALGSWLELLGLPAADDISQERSRFGLVPYSILMTIPETALEARSGLYVRTRNDLIVGFRPKRGATLLDRNGEKEIGTPIKIFDGRWIWSEGAPPRDMSFLPPAIKALPDPHELFEDTLISVLVPTGGDGVYTLTVGSEKGQQRNYLYPFKPEILEYFSSDQIAEFTKISSAPSDDSLEVQLNIPLEGGRTVRITRRYPLEGGLLVKAVTAELAMWPDFQSPLWQRYYYFKRRSAAAGAQQLDFEPIGETTHRSAKPSHWYASHVPVEAFTGRVDEKSGLLLVRTSAIAGRNKYWKVAIDFGSTHTRAFYLEVERDGALDGATFTAVRDAKAQPLPVRACARELTVCTPHVLRDGFLALSGALKPAERVELKTQLMKPIAEPSPAGAYDWLPSDGFVFLHWLYHGDYDAQHFHYNLKWNSNTEDSNLRSFLQSFLIMIEAEAARNGAEIVSVDYTYPSAFSPSLIAKHQQEWAALQAFMNRSPSTRSVPMSVPVAAITETVAVCRHLEHDQQASATGRVISLDVGGSTTDIAVWAEGTLRLQESVKFAAGLITGYMQSSAAKPFLHELERILRDPPHKIELSTEKFSQLPGGYGLMFVNLLSYAEAHGTLAKLKQRIITSDKCLPFVSHVMFVFGGLLYYSGLLARKAHLNASPDHSFEVWLCGKGGTLADWIQSMDEFVSEMFSAGLRGPSSKGEIAPTVRARLSSMPKEEVGRGLLADSVLQGTVRKHKGIIDTTPPSVTVGEEGYGHLEWHGELTKEKLETLTIASMPRDEKLVELHGFVEAFKSGATTSQAAKLLKLQEVAWSAYHDKLVNRLFGSTGQSVIERVKRNDPNAMIEPLFVTELKVLVEMLTPGVEPFA